MKKAILFAGIAFVALVAASLTLSPTLQRRIIRSTKARPLMMSYFKWSSASKIEKYFSEKSVRKVQVGSGDYRLQGWLNTDIEPDIDTIYMDATERFPFPDASIDYIFSEQMIEHIPYSEGIVMLKECFRVLKHGGKVRTATPDLSRYIELFEAPQSEQAKQFIREKMKYHSWIPTRSPEVMIINMQMREWGHAFLYDKATLREIHEKAGFKLISECKQGESPDPALRGIDFRIHREPQIAYFENMVFEAVKN
jgi:predicted SAM-dependent methyltransferase